MVITGKRYLEKEKVVLVSEVSYPGSVYNVSLGWNMHYTVDKRKYKKTAPDKIKIIWCFCITLIALLLVFLFIKHILIAGISMLTIDTLGIAFISCANKTLSSWTSYDDGSDW